MKEAIKLALEALKTNQPLTAHKVLEEALAKQEQGEPVGEVVDATDGAFKCAFNKTLPIGAKLYTAPLQRAWVGLTDEEAVALMKQIPHLTVGSLLAIEAKLKEKNGIAQQAKLAPVQQSNWNAPKQCDSPAICRIRRTCVGQYGTKMQCTAAQPAVPAVPAVPDGWKLVPIEPTFHQIKVLMKDWHLTEPKHYIERYKAVIAAATQGSDKLVTPDLSPLRKSLGLPSNASFTDVYESVNNLKDRP